MELEIFLARMTRSDYRVTITEEELTAMAIEAGMVHVTARRPDETVTDWLDSMLTTDDDEEIQRQAFLIKSLIESASEQYAHEAVAVTGIDWDDSEDAEIDLVPTEVVTAV